MVDFETITKEQLESLYKNNSILGVASILGVSNYKVEKKLSQFGIQKHSRKDSILFGTRAIHGVDNVMLVDDVKEKLKQSNIQKYGVGCVLQLDNVKEKISNTCMDRYGVRYSADIPERRNKASITTIERYGRGNGNNRQKALNTMLEKYGVPHALQNKDVLQKSIDTCLCKYGVMYNCQTPQCNHKGSKYSKVNELVHQILTQRFPNKEIHTEFPIDNFLYDFCIDNYLIEINPTITHNVDFSPYGNKHSGIAKDYHKNKALVAIKNGYLPIFVYDWDDINQVIDKMFVEESIVNDCNTIIDIDKFYCDYEQLGLLPNDWCDDIIENIVMYDIKNKKIDSVHGYRVYTAGKLIIKT